MPAALLAALLAGLPPGARAGESPDPAIGRGSVASAALGATDSGGPADPAKLQQLYDEAFTLYQGGDYSKAIASWNRVLRLDPAQKSAREMIAKARGEVKGKGRERREKVSALIRGGRYEKALVEMEALLELDATHPEHRALFARLEEVAGVVPSAPAGRAWRAAALGLGAVLRSPEDLRLAYNGLRYAAELDPGEARFGKLIELLLVRHPELALTDALPPGAKLLDHKRALGLQSIYDGKYAAAAQAFNDVLVLEPDDLVALKRLGSAYFALGQREKAREAWTRAARLAPKDAQLGEFLDKLKARR